MSITSPQKSLSPSDFKLMRKTAKLVKKTNGVKHAEALELVAKTNGFSSWSDVASAEKDALNMVATTALPAIPDEIPQQDRLVERSTDLESATKLLLSSNREFLARKGIDYSIFEPTATGLKKSILDATQPVRTHFDMAGFHNYRQQQKGQAHKVKHDAFFVTDRGMVPSTVSLYRPETKDGDPRMWFRGLPDFAEPSDQIAIIVLDGCPYLLKMSDLQLESAASSNPTISNFIQRCTLLSDRATELLEKLRQIAKAPIPAPTAGATGIGMAVEKALGIPANSSKKPDYYGIELKSGRASKVRSNLFAQVADWKLSQRKSSAEILDGYGYSRENDFRLYCTIRADRPNSQGLVLRYDEKNDLLEEFHSDGSSVAVWPGNLLRGRLKEKHNETFWIKARAEIINGVEHFHLQSVVHTKAPLLNQLLPLLASGVVTMDHLIKRTSDGKVREKGPLFKIDKANLKLLFPDPIEYCLTE